MISTKRRRFKGGETLGRPPKKTGGPPQNHSKIGGDDDFDVISRKIFRDFSTDFFGNKGPPLCFFEKSSKIPKLNPGANRGGSTYQKNSFGSVLFNQKYTMWTGAIVTFWRFLKSAPMGSPLKHS